MDEAILCHNLLALGALSGTRTPQDKDHGGFATRHLIKDEGEEVIII